MTTLSVVERKNKIGFTQTLLDIIGVGVGDYVDLSSSGGDTLTIKKHVTPPPPPPPPPLPTCNPNAHYDTSLAKCVCNSGYHDDGSGNCIIDTPTCNTNAHYDAALARCVCDTGYHDNGAGSCVADTVAPTVLLQENFSGYGNYSIPAGGLTKDGKMKNIWGLANVMNDPSGYFVRVQSPYNGDGNGISALFLSTESFSDVKISYKMRVNKFTWTNPLNYHGGWFMQRYYDVTHHYYEYLQRDGDIECGKKDNLPNDSALENQLFVGPQPHFENLVLGKWYTFEWTMKNNTDGSITITISGDHGTGMTQLFNFVDAAQEGHLPTDLVKSGRFGPYVEDAQVDYTNIVITAV